MGAGCSSSLVDLGQLDRLARGQSPIHRLDPRAKLLSALAFAVLVVSVDKYALGDLLAFFVFPIFLLVRSNIPPGFVIKRLLAVAPFAVMVGAFNPFFDQEIVLQIGGFGITGGWVSFFSILVRVLLTVGVLILLAATTGIPALGQGAEKLGVPGIFVAQLLGLYRYLFLLAEETARVTRAYRLRAAGRKTPSWRVFSAIVGQLLLRALERAQRVYQAMRLRGFDGDIRRLSSMTFTRKDGLFLFGWVGVFLVLRFFQPAELLGQVALELGR
ncbi:MAG: cobalt ECF transporter T component CbiQ [Alphaproteobacteria bacterium]|nr:cobalt ECF transporter T component CbiQ [Alphaproteobacteria bacterium]